VNRLITYLKHNALGAIALFIALGGTSYAAVAIPRDSVGSRQLRTGAVTSTKIHSGAVTPGKLSGTAFGGRILYLALIGSDGKVEVSNPKGIRTSDWNLNSGGIVVFPHRLPKGCVPLAGGASPVAIPVSGNPGPPAVGVAIEGNRTQAQLATNGATPVTLEILCEG
jgi:hypothetical protein